VAIDLELQGTCLYNDPTVGGKLPCHWERSADGIVVSVTINPFINTPSVWTLHLRWADDKFSYVGRDGIGGGVCIQLAKDKAVADCHGMMMGMPPPHPPSPLR